MSSAPAGPLVCSSCGREHPREERFCVSCGMPLVYGDAVPVAPSQAQERARKVKKQFLDGPLVVVSDSTYVVNCFRDGWWKGWIARGWLTSAKKPVVSRDLWEPLVELVNERGDVSFRWVKGHSGDAMNDLVDALAVEQSHAVA